METLRRMRCWNTSFKGNNGQSCTGTRRSRVINLILQPHEGAQRSSEGPPPSCRRLTVCLVSFLPFGEKRANMSFRVSLRAAPQSIVGFGRDILQTFFHKSSDISWLHFSLKGRNNDIIRVYPSTFRSFRVGGGNPLSSHEAVALVIQLFYSWHDIWPWTQSSTSLFKQLWLYKKYSAEKNIFESTF